VNRNPSPHVMWPLYGLGLLAAATILGRVFWDALFERFDSTALYLTSLIGAAILLPILLRELPRIRKVKVGGTEFELADLEAQLPNVTPRPGAGQADMFIRSNDVEIRVDESWEDLRRNVKETSRNIFLAHVLRPSNRPRQKFDIFMFLVRPKSPGLDDVEYAEFFFGRYWGNRVFKVVNRGQQRIGLATSAFGPFAAVCKLTFRDGGEAITYRLIDFEMGRLFQEQPQEPV
jgi:hypothetical protein